ncbi:MAG: aminopeptidase N [Gammaproteobacteria bacterium]|nr:aminopeptidase N [Gammaproteobacteria bacterium]
MSEPLIVEATKSSPKTIYLKDYEIPAYLIDEIHLQFDLQEDFTYVTSHMRVRHNRQSRNLSKQLVLNGEELILESIKLDGIDLTPQQYEVSDTYLIVKNVPDNFSLDITVKIFPQKNTALSGLYRSQNTYCTQCEAEGFRRITYFIDQPDILTRFTTTIIADPKQFPYLLSNGNPIGEGFTEERRHWVKWEDPFRKPSYLFALVAGDFDVVSDTFITQSEQEIAIKVYVEKGYADQVSHAIFSLKEAMRWDEKVYGREYDLDIYMIVAIGDFNMGAMENKGLNIFNTKYVLAKPETATDEDYMHITSVVGHEYFHNWSGNRVTCRDWFQLSLKEGLTIFRDQSFSEDLFSPGVIRIQEVRALRETQFSEDAGPLAHPVRPDSYIEINNFYTSTVYNKGAEVHRMLKAIVGPVYFRKGMDLYFARHDGQAVTIEDYIKTMEDVSGIDLNQFRLWYSQAGTPLVTIADDYDTAQQVYTLTINQSCPATPGQSDKEPMLIPIRMSLFDHAGKEILLDTGDDQIEVEKVLKLSKASQSFQFKNVPSRPIPSLLRNFSAPVVLNYPYADEDLLFLFKFDTDPFNRYEAGQKYMLRVMQNLIRDVQQQNALEVPRALIEAMQQLIQENKKDYFLLSEMLTLPSEKYIGEQMQTVDVVAIHQVREYVLKTIAEQLQDQFLATYKMFHKEGQSDFTLEEMGKRQFKNRCLAYLALLPAHAELVMQQFTDALEVNMTDTQAALTALTSMQSPLREQALDQFYDTWKHDALVVDKWLGVQAGTKLPNALQQVKKLTRHPAFDIKNPNKVYALIGTFGYRNAIHFHAENGEGYAFLRDIVHQLDKINPQVAARMVKPLTMWKRYDKDRQVLMRNQLELLLTDKPSSDLYELVTKSLEF